jgi:sugar phosphate isomerase/epimerase
VRVGFRMCGLPHLEAIALAKRLGFTDLEPEWWSRTSADFPDMAKAAREAGIRLSAVLTGQENMTLDEFKQAFEDCERIGAQSFTAYLLPIDVEDEAAKSAFQDRLGAAVELGRRYGVKVAAQSCGLYPEQWDLMFELVPGLCLKYDPSFSAQAGRNYAAEIFKYGSRIVHAHAKDEMVLEPAMERGRKAARFTYAPAGMGQVQWGTVIAALYEVGYDEQIAIEYHSHYWWPGQPGFERGLILAKRHLEQFFA